MVKRKNADTDETKINDDLEIFEELEREGNEPLPEESTEQMIDNDPPEPSTASAQNEIAKDISDLSPDVPVNLVAVIGKVTINVAELVKLHIGSVVDLGRSPGETVDLVANGRLIAKGELVDIDGKLGVKIIKMVR